MNRNVQDATMPSGACVCGLLRRLANDDDVPICYVLEFNEFHLTYRSSNHQGAIIIRYCPSCGGAAPASTRSRHYYEVSKVELERIYKLASAMASFDEAIATFGLPDEELTVTIERGQALKECRAAVYKNLSEVAEIKLIDHGPTRRLGVGITPKRRP